MAKFVVKIADCWWIDHLQECKVHIIVHQKRQTSKKNIFIATCKWTWWFFIKFFSRLCRILSERLWNIHMEFNKFQGSTEKVSNYFNNQKTRGKLKWISYTVWVISMWRKRRHIIELSDEGSEKMNKKNDMSLTFIKHISIVARLHSLIIISSSSSFVVTIDCIHIFKFIQFFCIFIYNNGFSFLARRVSIRSQRRWNWNLKFS